MDGSLIDNDGFQPAGESSLVVMYQCNDVRCHCFKNQSIIPIHLRGQMKRVNASSLSPKRLNHHLIVNWVSWVQSSKPQPTEMISSLVTPDSSMQVQSLLSCIFAYSFLPGNAYHHNLPY